MTSPSPQVNATSPVEVVRPRPLAKRVRRWLLEAGVALLVYLGMSGYQGRHLLSSLSPAPAFSVQSLDGHNVTLESFRGKRVILHFWATWCAVCRREFSMLNSLARELPDNTALLTLVAADDADAVRSLAQEHKLEYPIAIASDELVRRFKVHAFPTNYFLDEEGRITSSSVGMSAGWAMRARASCNAALFP